MRVRADRMEEWMADNVLYYGDNLDVLRHNLKDESVDLVYLDPPFNSNASYNVLFAAQDGTRSAAQLKAFEDTWQWDQAAAYDCQRTVEAGGQVSQAMQAFRTLLGPSNMLAYLAMMAPRLKELRRVLRPTGSLYLHCDPTASHYLKLLLDAIFGAEGFGTRLLGSDQARRMIRFATVVATTFSFSTRFASASPGYPVPSVPGRINHQELYARRARHW
jgi:adenine specific DNA methylase Mod